MWYNDANNQQPHCQDRRKGVWDEIDINVCLCELRELSMIWLLWWKNLALWWPAAASHSQNWLHG